MDFFQIAFLFVLGVLFCAMLLVSFYIVRPRLKGFFSGARVSLMDIVGMRMRGTPPNFLVDALMILRMRGRDDIEMKEVEITYISNKHLITNENSLAELVQQEYPPIDANRKRR